MTDPELFALVKKVGAYSSYLEAEDASVARTKKLYNAAEEDFESAKKSRESVFQTLNDAQLLLQKEYHRRQELLIVQVASEQEPDFNSRAREDNPN